MINIQNSDQACFGSIVAAFTNNIKKPERVSSYPHYSTQLILDNISFPVSIKDISLFEKLNNIIALMYMD